MAVFLANYFDKMTVFLFFSVFCPVPSLRKTGCTLDTMPIASNVDFNKVCPYCRLNVMSVYISARSDEESS